MEKLLRQRVVSVGAVRPTVADDAEDAENAGADRI
jgi:hypothetical protein